eukprot:GFUD01087584.1.p1 GENE.GFUD01087584.1~~GFUD01087584.1.p1  ORF type:complete len:1093 (-),score=287.76 GFUD01087584.1:55-2910(-)
MSENHCEFKDAGDDKIRPLDAVCAGEDTINRSTECEDITGQNLPQHALLKKIPKEEHNMECQQKENEANIDWSFWGLTEEDDIFLPLTLGDTSEKQDIYKDSHWDSIRKANESIKDNLTSLEIAKEDRSNHSKLSLVAEIQKTDTEVSEEDNIDDDHSSKLKAAGDNMTDPMRPKHNEGFQQIGGAAASEEMTIGNTQVIKNMSRNMPGDKKRTHTGHRETEDTQNNGAIMASVDTIKFENLISRNTNKLYSKKENGDRTATINKVSMDCDETRPFNIKNRSRIYIALDDIDEVATPFKIEEAKDPEIIRDKLKQNVPPLFVYEGGEKDKRKEIGRDELLPGHIYVWYTPKETWQNKEIVQNALFCADAVYKPSPFQTLTGVREFHTVTEVVGVGCYRDDDHMQRCLICVAENGDTRERMLIISFKGSKMPQDWRDNINFGLKADLAYLGKFHAGFHKRATIMRMSDIKEMAILKKVNIILTCGHSLGGAVSSIVHMNIVKSYDTLYPVVKKNIINITFGAPYFGNEGLKHHAKDKDFSRNMFHFASVLDIIPSLLSMGHSVKSVQDQVTEKASILTGGLSEVWKQWAMKNNKKLNIVSEFCSNVLEIHFNHTENGKKHHLKDIFESMREVNNNLEASSLQNGYRENSYVPIGKYIILAYGRDAESLDHGGKIIERILQAAVEKASADCNIRDILAGHKLESYIHLIKNTLQGFKQFPNQNNKIHKKPVDECFQHFQFEYPCAYNDCEKRTSGIPVYQQRGVVICKTCEADENIEEHFYHKDCSRKFHVNREDHVVTTSTGRTAFRAISKEDTKKKLEKEEQKKKQVVTKQQMQEENILDEQQMHAEFHLHQEHTIEMRNLEEPIRTQRTHRPLMPSPSLEEKLQTLVSLPSAPPPLKKMAPPTKIFNCPNGHLVCGACNKKVSNCSLCAMQVMGRATGMEQTLRTWYNSE